MTYRKICSNKLALLHNQEELTIKYVCIKRIDELNFAKQFPCRRAIDDLGLLDWKVVRLQAKAKSDR